MGEEDEGCKERGCALKAVRLGLRARGCSLGAARSALHRALIHFYCPPPHLRLIHSAAP